MEKIKEIIKNNKITLIVLLVAFIIFLLGFSIYYYNTYKIHPNFNKINLKGYNKLMIVAHPDDEILWGGKALIEDDYLVVCITCGTVKSRVYEFVTVMHETNDKYIMLGYPDKTNGERDNWESVYDDIEKDLIAITKLKDWELIVVHNPDGEYGHQHHKMASQFVTSLVDDKSKLYYFGHYYSKDNIAAHEDEMSSIDGKTLEKKVRIIGLYKSQSFIQTTFDHMFEHEDWLSYYEWMSESNEDA
jgi:LmbE family N-acetylglucosaminyl deacetylase